MIIKSQKAYQFETQVTRTIIDEETGEEDYSFIVPDRICGKQSYLLVQSGLIYIDHRVKGMEGRNN